jgi:response regulator RpfG family c-di-GMP phosphodiesterase
MHDVGKIGIPDSILFKPGKLTDEEYEVIKTHTTLGHSILKNSSRRIMRTAATIALQHHERWDGQGYPRGLVGEDTHIFGRITALADVFDALACARVYKKAWPLDAILAYLREQAWSAVRSGPGRCFSGKSA